MSDAHDDPSPLADFAGTARLFPLPNLVLFPNVMQPLHIFEPRYRQMTDDALADDRLIALALLKPGWESDYEGAPDLHPVACLGKIVAEQRLEDGRFNILLRGLSRIRIQHELVHGKLYRSARVELLKEVSPPGKSAARSLRQQITGLVTSWFPAQGAVLEQFRKLLKSDLPLGALCDIIAFALPLPVECKQELLEEIEIDRRVRKLLHHLETASPPSVAASESRKFPPEFSAN
jgi:Lon protease-like protein